MISCDKHDYIEVACLYRLAVELTLSSGEKYSGQAKDIQLDENRNECILLSLENGGDKTIPLSDIKQLRALTKNPHFDLVTLP